MTGATGNVGRPLVAALLERGARVIAAGHSPERLSAAFGESVPVARLDFYDPSTWPGALVGAERMFLMRPPAISDVSRTLCPLVDLARSHGVGHVVFLSVAGAERSRMVPHRAVEDHLRSRGDDHTCLRPGFFAQNLQSAYREDIASDGRIYVPAGRRQPVNWIDARDIAEVAADILVAPGPHRGAGYTLAGPGPVPWSEVVASLTAALGRPIRYVPASVAGYAWHLSRRGLPWGAVAVQTLLHFGLRLGQGRRTDPTLARLLGRPSRSIHDYIADNVEQWARPG